MNPRTIQKNIFEPISIGDATPTSAEHDLIQNINELINFINRFPFAKINTLQKESKKLHSEINQGNPTLPDLQKAKQIIKYQGIIKGTLNRFDFVQMLTDDRTRLRNALETHWKNKQKNGERVSDEDIQQKLTRFDQTLTEFAGYARFAHLTADELAITAIIVDDLIKAVQQSLAKLSNSTVKQLIENKLGELEKAKEEIKKCIDKYKAIYVKNVPPQQPITTAPVNDDPLMRSAIDMGEQIKQTSTENNDLLLPLVATINQLFNKEMVKLTEWEANTDATIVANVPQLPYEDRPRKMTVFGYFENYGKEKTTNNSSYFYVDIIWDSLKNSAAWLASYALTAAQATAEVAVNGVNATVTVLSDTLKKASEMISLTASADSTTTLVAQYEKNIVEIKQQQEQRKSTTNNDPQPELPEQSWIPIDNVSEKPDNSLEELLQVCDQVCGESKKLWEEEPLPITEAVEEHAIKALKTACQTYQTDLRVAISKETNGISETNINGEPLLDLWAERIRKGETITGIPKTSNEALRKRNAMTDMQAALENKDPTIKPHEKLLKFATEFDKNRTLLETPRDSKIMTTLKLIGTVLSCLTVIGAIVIVPFIWKVRGSVFSAKVDTTLNKYARDIRFFNERKRKVPDTVELDERKQKQQHQV